MARPLRLGFPVKVMGAPELKSHDTRRWANNPHLKASLEYLDGIFDYLRRHRIDMYRMSSDLAPYVTHPDMPWFHGMIAESESELRAIGRKARELELRLSFHPSQFVVLNSPDPALVRKSVWDLATQAEMLDLMELGPEAVAVIHVGGAYGDRPTGVRRWIETWRTLPARPTPPLLEHDDVRFSAADVLWIHQHTGVRLVFDYQHFWCCNPERLDLLDALRAILETWPDGIRPKIHFSTPRTELREVARKRRKTGKTEKVYAAPVWTGHADFCNPFEFATFMRTASGLEFDVMLESKAKDLALIRLRPDMLRYADDVAARFGLTPDAGATARARTGGAAPGARGGRHLTDAARAPRRNRECAAAWRATLHATRLDGGVREVTRWRRWHPWLKPSALCCRRGARRWPSRNHPRAV